MMKHSNANVLTLSFKIVCEETVDELSKQIGIPLNPERFRPNIILAGAPAWSEFNWVGKTLQGESGLRLSVINKTVRCQGVSVDPSDPENVLDVPRLLIEHFPEHGPFLGIYATIEQCGNLSLGSRFQLN